MARQPVMRMRLSPGEILWMVRRMLGETVAEMARLLDVSEDRYRRWEKDREPIDELVYPLPPLIRTALHWGTGFGAISAGTACTLARRRMGWTHKDLGARIFRSKVAIINAEHDRVATDYLVNCWVLLGWPVNRKAHRYVATTEWTLHLLKTPE